MKYITFTVPCYNSQDYMSHCIDSLLTVGRDAEIIIVDDGSKDNTGAIADAYAEKYPNIVRVIHKENGGHGSGVNAGLAAAKGLYFKVVDSDDWLNERSLKKLLSVIKCRHNCGGDIDLYLCNYVYEHTDVGKSYPVRYKNVFPKLRPFSWKNTKSFRESQFLTMHSMIYRTALLRECKLELPLHTFYVDNIFITHPLPYVKSMYYINTDLYRYYIGRADQSVNENVFINRIDQQERVVLLMLQDYVKDKDRITSKKLDRYLIRHMGILISVVSVFYGIVGTEESLNMRKEFWRSIKRTDKKFYQKVRSTTIAGLTDLPGKGGRFLGKSGYKLTRKIYKY